MGSSLPRPGLALIFTGVGLAWAGSLGTALAAGSSGPATTKIATLKHATRFHTAARTDSRTIETVAARRPITGRRTALPVIDTSGDRRDGPTRTWLRVRLPGRPNSHAGWVRSSEVVLSTTPWRIAVDRSARRVSIYRAGERLRSFRAIVGRPGTPTPTGFFFVEESVAIRHDRVGAPYAFALSARSNVFQEFAGGPGQIGIHGTSGVSGALGTAVSHGCVRLSAAAVTWLSERIVPGTPATIAE